MKKIFLTSGFLFLILTCSFAQFTNWKNYTNGNSIYATAVHNNQVWVGSTGGLILIDTSSGVTTFFNKTNSPLPDNSIHALAVDNNGILWASILNFGIFRYDGTNWANYNSFNSLIGSDYIYHISTDAMNNVWLSTTNGLVKFDGTAWTSYTTSNSGIPDDFVDATAFDSYGILWVATLSGLGSYDGTNWTVYNTSNSGLTDNHLSLVVVKDTVKWITNWAGLNRFDGVNWTLYDTSNCPLLAYGGGCIAIDDNGTKWIGTYGGCVAFNDTSFSVYNTSMCGLPSNFINSISAGNNNEKWYGTMAAPIGNGYSKGGLVKYDGTNWTGFNTSNSGIAINSTSDIVIDAQDKKWIATTNGLAVYDGINWNSQDTLNNLLPDKNIFSFAIDKSGNKWIGTYSGVFKYDGANLTVYDTTNVLLSNKVATVTIAPDSSIWIGLFGGGIAKYDGTNWTSYTTANSQLPSDSVRVIKFDNTGDCWIGTEGMGIGVLHPSGNWTFYRADSTNLITDYITAIAVDSLNIKWIGSYLMGGGLNKFDGTNWERFTISNSGNPTPDVKTVSIDRQGNILLSAGSSHLFKTICAAPIGLIVFDRVSTWTIYGTSNSGIPDNDITASIADLNGDIWLTTEAGVGVFLNPAGTTSVQTDEIKTGEAVKIFPNPFHSITTVEINSTVKGEKSFSLFDIFGREMIKLENILNNRFEIKNNNLSHGIYFYKATADKEIIATGKIVLE